MRRLTDKCLLFCLCSAWYLRQVQSEYAVLPVLIAVILGSVLSLLTQKRPQAFLFLGGMAACAAAPGLVYFLPFLCYDVFAWRRVWVFFAAAVPVAVTWYGGEPALAGWLALLCAAAVLLARRTQTLEKLTAESAALLDDAREAQRRLAQKNSELLQKQDFEVRLATLTERNRIARDIHDTVGHLLSSAILQTGALLAVAHDAAAQESLRTLRDTLAQGMDSVRADIHDLHDQSVDLAMESQRLVEGFSFCPAKLEYDVDESPPGKVRYALLFVLKESLANIVKHSQATAVHVLLREHPGFYQLVVRDNGRGCRAADGGLGLRNIRERIEALGGRAHFEGENGFTVFVTIPKEGGT